MTLLLLPIEQAVNPVARKVSSRLRANPVEKKEKSGAIAPSILQYALKLGKAQLTDGNSVFTVTKQNSTPKFRNLGKVAYSGTIQGIEH